MSNENEWLERGTLRKSEKIEREHYRGDKEGEEEEEEEEEGGRSPRGKIRASASFRSVVLRKLSSSFFTEKE